MISFIKKRKSFPNHKAWMNGEARAWSGDKVSLNTVRAKLKVGPKGAKRKHQQRLKRDPNTNSTIDMLQTIQLVGKKDGIPYHNPCLHTLWE